jgi:hypothetical protein
MSKNDEFRHDCTSCAGGCAERHTEEKSLEEASAAPYLLLAAILIVLVSLLVKWLM